MKGMGEEIRKWTSIGLRKRQICFLEGISKGCRYSGGRKMSRTSIIRAFLKSCRSLDIDVSNVKSERELRKRFLEFFK